MKVLSKLQRCLLMTIFIISIPYSTLAALPDSTQPSLAKMLAKVMPSVVNIRVIVKPDPYLSLDENGQPPAQPGQPSTEPPSALPGQPQVTPQVPPIAPGETSPQAEQGRLGSGVIINAKKGYIVTNAHVVRDAQNIQVILKNASQYRAKLIGEDDKADVAVIQIQATDLQAIPIGNSYNLQVGDFVAAIGSPFGLNQTVTSGIISSLQRNNVSSSGFQDFIQTDAPINPGNSGGALVNLKGQFIGMNTAIISADGSSSGIGFAIPSNIVINIAKQLIKYGKVMRGLIGVMAQDVTPDIAKALSIKSTKGAIISSVNQASPAAQAGIQVGDVITKINGHPIANSGELVSMMGLLRADSKVHLNLQRGHKTMNISAILATPAQIKSVISEALPYFNGLILQNVHELDPLQGQVTGIQVLNVAQDSNAMRAGFLPGDIIISANLVPTTSTDDLHAAAISANHQPILLNVIRNSSAVFLVLKPDTKNEFN